MNEKERTPGSAATLTGAVETASMDTSFPSVIHYNTVPERKQGQIEKLLLHGEDNAIPTRTLVQLTGTRSARQLQSVIERERLNGALILSTSRRGGGYFLPKNGEEGQAEVAAFVRTCRARAINTLRTLKAARRALEQLDGQQQIEEVQV